MSSPASSGSKLANGAGMPIDASEPDRVNAGEVVALKWPAGGNGYAVPDARSPAGVLGGTIIGVVPPLPDASELACWAVCDRRAALWASLAAVICWSRCASGAMRSATG